MCLQTSLLFSFLKVIVLASLLAQASRETIDEVVDDSYRDFNRKFFIISDDYRRRTLAEDCDEEDEIGKTQTKSKDQ